MGHVKDLAEAFVKVVGNPKAAGQVYNISGEKYVTFDGLAKACAKAAGAPEPELIHYKPKDFDFGKKKAFPFRDQHFFASIEKAKRDLNWEPKFDLLEGLRDSYEARARRHISSTIPTGRPCRASRSASLFTRSLGRYVTWCFVCVHLRLSLTASLRCGLFCLSRAQKDFGRGTCREPADFFTDDMIIGRAKGW